MKWDIRFLKLAEHISLWSKDPSTQTGAVITRRDHTIVSVGYNGFPKNMPDSKEWYANREDKYSRIVHCEVNALIHAYQSTIGYTLYTWPFVSCDRCCVQMLQAGIARFVFPALAEDKKDRWEESMNKSKDYILDCGATFTEIPREQL